MIMMIIISETAIVTHNMIISNNIVIITTNLSYDNHHRVPSAQSVPQFEQCSAQRVINRHHRMTNISFHLHPWHLQQQNHASHNTEISKSKSVFVEKKIYISGLYVYIYLYLYSANKYIHLHNIPTLLASLSLSRIICIDTAFVRHEYLTSIIGSCTSYVSRTSKPHYIYIYFCLSSLNKRNKKIVLQFRFSKGRVA